MAELTSSSIYACREKAWETHGKPPQPHKCFSHRDQGTENALNERKKLKGSHTGENSPAQLVQSLLPKHPSGISLQHSPLSFPDGRHSLVIGLWAELTLAMPQDEKQDMDAQVLFVGAHLAHESGWSSGGG